MREELHLYANNAGAMVGPITLVEVTFLLAHGRTGLHFRRCLMRNPFPAPFGRGRRTSAFRTESHSRHAESQPRRLRSYRPFESNVATGSGPPAAHGMASCCHGKYWGRP